MILVIVVQEHHLVERFEICQRSEAFELVIRSGENKVPSGDSKRIPEFDIQRVPGHVTIVSFCGVFGYAFLLLSYTSNINMQYTVIISNLSS